MELPKFSTVYSLTGLVTEWSRHVPANERETVLVEKYRALGVAALDELGNHWVNDADLQEAVAARVKPEIEHEFPDSLKEPVKNARVWYGTWLLQHAHAAARSERDRLQGKARGAVDETEMLTTPPAPGPQP